MKHITYECDRCGCSLDEGAARSTRNIATKTEIRYKLRFFRKWKNEEPLITEHELCDECRESLERWLNNENA